MGFTIPGIRIPYGVSAENTTTVKVPKITALTKTGGGTHSAPITHTPTPSRSSGGSRGGGGKRGGSGGKTKTPSTKTPKK